MKVGKSRITVDRARCSKGSERRIKLLFSGSSAGVWLCTHKCKNIGEETANRHLSALTCNEVSAKQAPFVCQHKPKPTSTEAMAENVALSVLPVFT